MQNDWPKKRARRGKVISVEEFCKKYELQPEEAHRLYKISGPSEYDLDLLMAAKGIVPTKSEGPTL
ncbi:hypothetical protein [Rhizobium sp. Root483D2]|uniref:hypothetical protein n=1 Tax=Rhizobium sp. Root483D2 TaxID=1736545 RepID=UPI000714F8E6|nr:hypothetical protein [Rhizobium sp. Root483D2]KQY20204.1 hypothetical protein ASD32_06985 [Rhizobium sp. Root483D2]